MKKFFLISATIVSFVFCSALTGEARTVASQPNYSAAVPGGMQPGTAQQTVYRAKKKGSGLYHQKPCKYYPRKLRWAVEFKSQEEAMKAGYKPCKYCIHR